MADSLVEIEGRRLKLTNLDKVLYPETGFTKGEVIDYYARMAPVMLPHLKDRPATRIRWPEGVDGGKFFEKNAPSHTPDWVRTAEIPTPGSSSGQRVRLKRSRRSSKSACGMAIVKGLLSIVALSIATTSYCLAA